MPVAPRWNKKATKIAFDIIGTPPNLKFKPTAKEIEINKTIVVQDSLRK